MWNWVSWKELPPVVWMTVLLELTESDNGLETSEAPFWKILPVTTASWKKCVCEKKLLVKKYCHFPKSSFCFHYLKLIYVST